MLKFSSEMNGTLWKEMRYNCDLMRERYMLKKIQCNSVYNCMDEKMPMFWTLENPLENLSMSLGFYTFENIFGWMLSLFWKKYTYQLMCLSDLTPQKKKITPLWILCTKRKGKSRNRRKFPFGGLVWSIVGGAVVGIK